MKPLHRPLVPLVLVTAALALAGCSASEEPAPGPSIPPGITAPPPTAPAAEAPPEIESSLPAEIAGVDTTGWQQVPVPSGSATFRIPAEWTVAEAPGGLEVLSPAGQRQLGYAEDPDTGDGTCVDAAGTPVAWRTLGLDRQEVAIDGVAGAAYGAAALQLGDQWVFSMGLLPADAAQRPQCPIVNAIETPAGIVSFGSEVVASGSGDGSPWAVASLDAAQQYVADPEYATLRAIVMSLELLEG
ncbi:hypothetical protein [Agrococcus sp. TF02-05]|uniref:hypothetical protein n=1 Tax=Agrococcus sp. TF02-05 TaxID=2815211 RepID=UPI001AA1D383|nr:hypothetical protein [Agrococcus sp. TF02-05]MBO1770897.1 hypothetical protein [Agrococcus sp. TF02-05]